MLLSAKDRSKGRLWDLDTGERVRGFIWVDLDSGLFEAYQLDRDNRPKRDAAGNYLTYRAHARLKWEPLLPPAPMAGERCEATGGRIDPRGTCGCKACRVFNTLPTPAPVRTKRVKKIPVPLFDCRCQHYGCGRPADWMVSDEVALPPEEHDGVLYGRAKTVAVRHYCAFHYRAPRVLAPNGDVVEIDGEAHGVRPQWHSS